MPLCAHSRAAWSSLPGPTCVRAHTPRSRRRRPRHQCVLRHSPPVVAHGHRLVDGAQRLPHLLNGVREDVLMAGEDHNGGVGGVRGWATATARARAHPPPSRPAGAYLLGAAVHLAHRHQLGDLEWRGRGGGDVDRVHRGCAALSVQVAAVQREGAAPAGGSLSRAATLAGAGCSCCPSCSPRPVYEQGQGGGGRRQRWDAREQRPITPTHPPTHSAIHPSPPQSRPPCQSWTAGCSLGR